MNRHIEELMQYPSHILQSRIEALEAEWDRERGSLPIKLLAFLAALLSLFSLGTTYGFNTLVFILSAAVIAVFGIVVAVGIWGLRANLRDSKAALGQMTG